MHAEEEVGPLIKVGGVFLSTSDCHARGEGGEGPGSPPSLASPAFPVDRPIDHLSVLGTQLEGAGWVACSGLWWPLPLPHTEEEHPPTPLPGLPECWSSPFAKHTLCLSFLVAWPLPLL